MKNLFRVAFTFSLFLNLYAYASTGLDVHAATSVSAFTCLKNNGMDFAFVRAFKSSGILDTNAIANLQNARLSKMWTQVIMFPCRGKNVTEQVYSLISQIPEKLYQTVWIDVETNPSSGCSWKDYSANSNCQFIADLIQAIWSNNKSGGVYTSAAQWQNIFGDISACPQASRVPLWYVHHDDTPSFDDFKAFGGWKFPEVKQYVGNVTLCGVNINKNHR